MGFHLGLPRPLFRYGWRLVGSMALASFAGGWIGSELLLHTSNVQFAKLVPWLMLSACFLLLRDRYEGLA